MSQQKMEAAIKKVLTASVKDLSKAFLAQGFILKTEKRKNSVAFVPVVRFTDNGDGTITDNKSGLMWVKNPHTDLPEKFKERFNSRDAIQACKDLDFAGKKDWRLPTVEELRELVDYTRAAGDDPAIDTTFFPDTKTSWYWTVTPVAWDADYAWFVGFCGGSVSTSSKGGSYYVRPVRLSQ
jgi:hypothetical protein